MTAKTVLIVDDEPEAGELLARLLSDDGYRVVVASSGEESLKLARVQPPALVLLDLAMPGMDGLAALERLRAQGCRALAVMVTGAGGLDAARRARALGVFEYLTKPVALPVLRAVVGEALAAGPTAPGHL